jgi:hypothetical protein
MDFTTFRNVAINMPAQIVRGGRRIVVRLLSWNPWQQVFFRLLDQWRLPLRLQQANLEAGVWMLRSAATPRPRKFTTMQQTQSEPPPTKPQGPAASLCAPKPVSHSPKSDNRVRLFKG